MQYFVSRSSDSFLSLNKEVKKIYHHINAHTFSGDTLYHLNLVTTLDKSDLFKWGHALALHREEKCHYLNHSILMWRYSALKYISFFCVNFWIKEILLEHTPKSQISQLNLSRISVRTLRRRRWTLFSNLKTQNLFSYLALGFGFNLLFYFFVYILKNRILVSEFWLCV